MSWQLLFVGLKSIGMLNPSTREMSGKSMLLNWFNANSASVFGGEPQPWHSNSPLQSPVSHLPRPLASKVHLVRPQMQAIVVPVLQ
jgi:hypothetical protein